MTNVSARAGSSEPRQIRHATENETALRMDTPLPARRRRAIGTHPSRAAPSNKQEDGSGTLAGAPTISEPATPVASRAGTPVYFKLLLTIGSLRNAVKMVPVEKLAIPLY